MLSWRNSPSPGGMQKVLGAFNRAGWERPRTAHYVRRRGNKTPAIKRPPRRLRRIFRSLNLHGVYERSQGKQKGGGRGVCRGRAGGKPPRVKEAHYSVMDCTCHTVSALFIPPKRCPRPRRAFPYPSEIYQVRAGGTWGAALRAPDRC